MKHIFKVGDMVEIPKSTNATWYGTFPITKIFKSGEMVIIEHPRLGGGEFSVNKIIPCKINWREVL